MHLQHLGFPIANDALYLHSNVAKRSKRNTTADRAAKLTEISETLSRVEKSSRTTTVELINNDGELGSNRNTALAADVTNGTQGEVICDSGREQREKRYKSNEEVDCLRSVVTCNDGDPSESRASVSREADGGCLLLKEDLTQDISKSTNTDFVVDPLCTHCPNLEPSGYVSFRHLPVSA